MKWNIFINLAIEGTIVPEPASSIFLTVGLLRLFRHPKNVSNK